MRMNKNYENNMKAMRECVPLLADWLGEQKPVKWAEEIRSTTGGVNVLVKAENGQTRPIYPMNSPQKDIKKAVDGFDLNMNTVSVVVGLGCGYLTKQLIKNRKKKHRTLVVEPIGDFYRIAFKLFDYSKAIREGWIFFLACEDDIRYGFSKVEESTIVENWYITMDQYTNVRPEYNEMRNLVFKTITAIRCNTGTVTGAGTIIAENDIKSLPYIIRKRGVVELKDLFKGKPAICVSTGPSLEKNIHLLLDEKIRKKFIILAVGQALRVLLAYGIKPDLATSVDFGPVNYTHYRGLLDCGVPLVSINRSYAKLLQNWQGPVIAAVSEAPGYEESVTGLLQAKGSLLQGGSVAHMNFGLALFMGCDPITIIGQDLAWEGDKTHTRLADEMGTVKRDAQGNLAWDVDDPNTAIEKREQQMGQQVPIMGYYGRSVYTNIGLLAFHSGFEQMFSYVIPKVINATEGGAKIRNCEQLSLQEVLDQYGKEDIDKTILEPFLTEAENADELVEKAKELLTSDIDGMRKIIIECDIALKACGKLSQKKISQKEKFKQMAINEKHSIEARRLSQKNALINLSIYAVTREISHRDLLVKGETKYLASQDGKKDLKTRIKRNRKILEAAKKAAKKFIPLYEKAYKLTESGVGRPEPEPLPDLKDVGDYFKIGNWAHPLLDAERIIGAAEADETDWGDAARVQNEAWDMRAKTIRKATAEYKKDKGMETVRFNDLVEQAQKAGREDKDFDKALELLEKAVKIKPDEDAVLWGLASTYHFTSRFEESLSYYSKLIQNNPDNLQYQFEAATVNLRSGDMISAFKMFESVMSKTEQYNHFYKSLSKLYMQADLLKEALVAIEMYLKTFNADHQGWEIKSDCLLKMGEKEGSEKAKGKALKIKAF